MGLDQLGSGRGRGGRAALFAGTGTALALAAPSGWLCWRLLSGSARSIGEELSQQLPLYAYLSLSTTVAFAVFGGLLGAVIHDRERLAAEMRDLSLTDALTSLRNTRYFHARLSEEIARVRRTGRPLSLIMIDLDHFKLLNDRLGHQAGDHALAHVGAVLREKVRESDVACRVGGEEFAVICPDTPAARAAEIAGRIRAAFEQGEWPGSMKGERLTGSFGVAERSADDSPDSLFRAADIALYAAKAAGRNTVKTTP